MINFCVSRVPGCCDQITGDVENVVGCKAADTISSSLITNKTMAGSVGRALIDVEGYDWDTIQVTTSLVEDAEPKTVIENTDKRHGAYKGRLSKFAIRIESQPSGGFSTRSVFEIKRPKL